MGHDKKITPTSSTTHWLLIIRSGVTRIKYCIIPHSLLTIVWNIRLEQEDCSNPLAVMRWDKMEFQEENIISLHAIGHRRRCNNVTWQKGCCLQYSYHSMRCDVITKQFISLTVPYCHSIRCGASEHNRKATLTNSCWAQEKCEAAWKKNLQSYPPSVV